MAVKKPVKAGYTLMVAVEEFVVNQDDGQTYAKGETFLVKTERVASIAEWIAVPATEQADSPELIKES